MDAPTTTPDRGRTTIEVPTGLDRDELFRLLGHERRRRTIRYLLEDEEGTADVDVLAAALADEGDDGPATGADRRRVATTLTHAHLPTLEAAGVVDYERDRNRVAATPLVVAFEPYLEPTPDAADGERDAAPGGPARPALAGVAGGSLATFLLLKVVGTAAVFGFALLVAVSAWWTATAR